jgi:hypothetical protein
MTMIPVAILATVDPVLRDAALLSLLTDLPGTGVLAQDLDPDTGTLRRIVSDQHGIAEDSTRPLAHACLGCAIREDSVPTLESMAAAGRWERIIWALPVSAETAPAARPLCRPDAVPGLELATVACVVDADQVEADLMGDELLADRDLALSADDRRSVGEASAAQLGHADLVLTIGDDPVGLTLADHLRGRRTLRSTLFGIRAEQVFAPRHSAGTPRRGSIRAASRLRMPRTRMGSGAWTCSARARCTRAGSWPGSVSWPVAAPGPGAGSTCSAGRDAWPCGTGPGVSCPSATAVRGGSAPRPPASCSPGWTTTGPEWPKVSPGC